MLILSHLDTSSSHNSAKTNILKHPLHHSAHSIIFAETPRTATTNRARNHFEVIQACAGVEVIPEGPLEGDHMANGREEMAV